MLGQFWYVLLKIKWLRLNADYSSSPVLLGRIIRGLAMRRRRNMPNG